MSSRSLWQRAWGSCFFVASALYPKKGGKTMHDCDCHQNIHSRWIYVFFSTRTHFWDKSIISWLYLFKYAWNKRITVGCSTGLATLVRLIITMEKEKLKSSPTDVIRIGSIKTPDIAVWVAHFNDIMAAIDDNTVIIYYSFLLFSTKTIFC